MSETVPLPSEESVFNSLRDYNSEAMRSLATAAIGDTATLQLVHTPIEGNAEAVNNDLSSAAASTLKGGRRVIDRIETSTYENEDGTVTTSSTGAFFRDASFYQPVYVQLDVIKSKSEEGKPPVPVRMTATRVQAPVRQDIRHRAMS
jgi:hypothetical protein